LTFVLALSCGKPDPLPTVTPTSAPTQAPTTEAPPATEVPAGTETVPVGDREVRMHLLRSTVQIIALTQEGGRLQPLWTGSGTVLSPDGLILTNAHVATDPNPRYRPDALGVALTVRSDEPPSLEYLAEIRAIDLDLDLAVIQIVSDLSGRPVDVEALDLEYVELGNSDVLELGDLLQILGYPGIGGETITFTEGVVSGFTREPSVDGRAFIKTDATIAGGNSGGLAASEGTIIGVPTQVGYGGAERFADCRYLADTNGDGQINEEDNCIPVGGFINAIRPVNLAKPLVEAARLGISPQLPGDGDMGLEDASFYNLVFAPDVNEHDQPTRVISQLPAGAITLYACWNYKGMADGVTWEARWYLDGEYMEDVSWPPAPWKGGRNGSWWVSLDNDAGLPEGAYRLELFVEGEKMAEDTIEVGGSASDAGPTFSDLVFAADITDDEQPVDPAFLLPSGINVAYAFFDYNNMQDGMSWERIWYLEGEAVAQSTETWEAGASGRYWLSLSSDDPLPPGTYRLELFVEDRLIAASNFTVAGTQGQKALGPITFAAGVDARGNPVDPGTDFAGGLTELYYFIDYTGMRDGMTYGEVWYFDGEELLSMEIPWEGGESGTFHNYIYRDNGDPIWEGEYTLELYVEGQLVQTATTSVGGTAPPTPEPVSTEGLQIVGYVLDADTGRGIPGALYVVLQPGVDVDSWDGEEDGILTGAETDANGYFELPDRLPRDTSYDIIVWAEGYRPVVGDDILVSDEPSPFEVEVALQRE
jgi:S1-C subfamily serine protease